MEYIHAGIRIKNYLKLKGKTQNELARALETSPAQIVRYLKQPNIKIHTAQRIANYLDASLVELLGINDA